MSSETGIRGLFSNKRISHTNISLILILWRIWLGYHLGRNKYYYTLIKRRDDLEEYMDVNYIYSLNFEATKIINCKIFSDSPHVHIKFGLKPGDEYFYKAEKNNYLSVAFDLNKKSYKNLIAKRIYESCKGEVNSEDSFSNMDNGQKLIMNEKEPPHVFTNYPDIIFNNK